VRRLFVSLVLGAALAGAVVRSGDASETRLPLKPRLTVGLLYPLTVHGWGFRPHEQVTVTLDNGRRGTRSVRANRAGTFAVRFSVRLARCSTVTIRAVGKQGSRVVHQPARPNCREP
jgi:hypothetical protein